MITGVCVYVNLISSILQPLNYGYHCIVNDSQMNGMIRNLFLCVVKVWSSETQKPLNSEQKRKCMKVRFFKLHYIDSIRVNDRW